MNFMKTFKYFNDIPKDFTGSCSISYYEIIIAYFINGKLHNEDSYAILYEHDIIAWYYKDKRYGLDNDFNNESWKKRVEQIKYLEREEELKIFK